jgi:hypothetical protein
MVTFLQYQHLTEARRRSPEYPFWFSFGFDAALKTRILAHKTAISCPAGSLACQDQSEAWAQFIQTTFNTTQQYRIDICDGFYYPRGNADAAEGHTWIEVDGHVFDPTAAQFKGYPDLDESNYEKTDERDVNDPNPYA